MGEGGGGGLFSVSVKIPSKIYEYGTSSYDTIVYRTMDNGPGEVQVSWSVGCHWVGEIIHYTIIRHWIAA